LFGQNKFFTFLNGYSCYVQNFTNLMCVKIKIVIYKPIGIKDHVMADKEIVVLLKVRDFEGSLVQHSR